VRYDRPELTTGRIAAQLLESPHVKRILREIERCRESSIDLAIATVVAVRGSAPHPPGTKLTIAADGATVGAVSGGCVEAEVIDAAERVIGGGAAQLLTFDARDADAIEQGLPCGGELEVHVERFADELQLRFAALAGRGERTALVSVVDKLGGVSGRVLVSPDREPLFSDTIGPAARQRAVAAGEQHLWDDHSILIETGSERLFVDLNTPATRLLVFGATDLAQALCATAIGLGWEVSVCDPRSRFATSERFPGAEVIVAWPDAAVLRAGAIDRSTAVAVLTHDAKIDDLALELALASDAAYIGALGSRRTQQERVIRLAERGIGSEQMGRLSAPIGLDIGATSAEETALSIASEIVAVLHNRAGGRLTDGAGRIHSSASATG
jgi:xanthine dehydrogenase accessory factor